MTESGLVIDRDRTAFDGVAGASDHLIELGERDARSALRAQIERLERECSAIVAGAFPHISPVRASSAGGEAVGGPCLLTLEELERMRDRLVGHTQDLHRLAGERAAYERASWAMLEDMKLEPGRYKFARLPVRDLGQGGCGVWKVRPRLGLIGMLAGWWHIKLSSGCPLARGPRGCAAPDRLPAERHRAVRAWRGVA